MLSIKELKVPLIVALAQLAVHLVFHANYGYFRDELYYIACSDHLDFGYVDQPPLSIAVLAANRALLGDSLFALRLLPALSSALVVMLGALMARALGGSRFSQGFAAVTVASAHVLVGVGRFYSMNAFDVLFWALASYTIIIILNTGDAKRWILFGAIVGLGLLNKFSIGFLCIGLAGGLLLTRHRKHLATRWFWFGAALAGVIFLPHLIWQMEHGFPTLEFMRNATQQKNISHTPLEFLLGQFRDVNFFNAPVWLAGLFYFFFHRNCNRTFGWMYVVIFIIMVAQNAKVYYLSPVYPLLLAGGSLLAEEAGQGRYRILVRRLYPALVVIWAMLVLPFSVPVLPVEQFIAYQRWLGLAPRAEERASLGDLPQYYADQFGWEEMVRTVADIYAGLPPEEKKECVLYARNYGEAAAIDLFGKQYGLPKALCAHNSYWYWGPGDKSGNVAIIFGGRRDLQENLDDLKRVFTNVQLVGTTQCRYCMPFENNRQIFLCRGINTTIQKLWPSERFYI